LYHRTIVAFKAIIARNVRCRNAFCTVDERRDVESTVARRRRRRNVPRRRHPIFGEAPLVPTITHRGGVSYIAVDHRPRHLWARRDAWSLCRISRGRTTLNKSPLGSRRFRVRACMRFHTRFRARFPRLIPYR